MLIHIYLAPFGVRFMTVNLDGAGAGLLAWGRTCPHHRELVAGPPFTTGRAPHLGFHFGLTARVSKTLGEPGQGVS